jgi:regulator of RNase E activity RraA
VFSLGTCPAGPRALRPPWSDGIRLGSLAITPNDYLFADDDGVVVVGGEHAARVVERAAEISEVERRQADLVRSGRTLRQQFRFADYLARRAADPAYTFRAHLRRIGGEIEE